MRTFPFTLSLFSFLALFFCLSPAIAHADTSSRPPVQADEIGDVCEYEAMPNTYETEHFFINYDRLGRGLTIEDYGAALEEAYELQVEDYGWAAPPLCEANDRECENANPWGKYPVQVTDLSGDRGDYDGFVNAVGDYTGVVGDNPNTPARETAAAATCMVIHSYTRQPEHGTKLEYVYGTAQHEFQHMVQYGYIGYGQNKSGDQIVGDMWYESIATFFEEESFDEVNYPSTYLWNDHHACMADYDRTGDPYANWLFFQYVAEQHGGVQKAEGGENLLQRFWEKAVRSKNALTTFDEVLQEYGTTLDTTFHDYALAYAFSKSCEGDYNAPYCLEEGDEYVAQAEGLPERDGTLKSATGEHRGTIREGYAMNFVELPAKGEYAVTLDNTARGGVLRGSLVCDTGEMLRITPFPEETIAHGDEGYVPYFDARDCEQVTAVMTSHTNNDACTARAYRLRLSAAEDAPPAAATPKPRATARSTDVASAPTRQPSTRPTRPAAGGDPAPTESGSALPLQCLPGLAALAALALWQRGRLG